LRAPAPGHGSREAIIVDIAIFGGTGGGEIAANVIMRAASHGAPVRIVGYLNDALPEGHALLGSVVIGTFEQWTTLPAHVRFVAPLHKAKAAQHRCGRVASLGIPDARWATVRDPLAMIAENATIAFGAVIGAFAVVDPGAHVGRHVALWPAAQIGHDATIGDFVFVGRGSVVSGYCTVATGSHLGPGAVVRDGCAIGRFAVVGAGATVVRDVPEFAVVAGNPARVIGRVDTPAPA
jgi:sugar O-acyltransferase (sialic acid O-acetyltransferase NeuD family)